MPIGDDLEAAAARLAAVLPGDPRREAPDAQRGFDWQRWLTVDAWLGLENEETLWIEWAEDFTVAGPMGVVTQQAKDRLAPISLGNRSTLELVEAAYARDSSVRTAIWTSAGVARERLGDLPEPAISAADLGSG